MYEVGGVRWDLGGDLYSFQSYFTCEHASIHPCWCEILKLILVQPEVVLIEDFILNKYSTPVPERSYFNI